MVNREQIKNGIINFVDNEVIPVLPTGGKWALGTIMIVAMQKYDKIFNEIITNDFIKMLEIVDANGMVDIDTLAAALKENANKYGKLQFQIPIVGCLTFSEADITSLVNHIKGE